MITAPDINNRADSLNAVALTGILAGTDLETCKQKLCVLLKATPEQIDLLFDRLPYTIKRGVDFDTATKYKTVLAAAGAASRIDSEFLHADLPPQATPRTKPEDERLENKKNFLGNEDNSLNLTALWKKSPIKAMAAAVGILVAFPVLIAGGIFVSVQVEKLRSDGNASSVNSSAQQSGEGTNGRNTNIVSAQTPKNEGVVLYKYWQLQNVPEPGVYQDELVDGKILLSCNASGGNPAHFGWIRVKTVFSMVAQPDAEPFKVFVGGINWGSRLQYFIEEEETNGKGILGRLKMAGCSIPVELQAPS